MGGQKSRGSNFSRQFGRSEFSIIRIKGGVVYPLGPTTTGSKENIQWLGQAEAWKNEDEEEMRKFCHR